MPPDPLSHRVKRILEARCTGRSEGWVWMSRCKERHIGEELVYGQWCGRGKQRDWPANLSSTVRATNSGSLVLAKTGNLKAVMNAMGHGDARSAMVYQHPEGEIIRNALNARHIPQHTVPDNNQASA